jgi:ParB family chromosome partitioning protein
VLGQSMSRSGDLDELYRALGGSDRDTLATAGEDRLRRSLVAKYLCTLETNLNSSTRQNGYWLDEPLAIAWYDELRKRGYPLTDDEQDLYDTWTASRVRDQDEEDDDDEEDQKEQPGPDPAEAPAAEPIGEPGDGEQSESIAGAVVIEMPLAPESDVVAARGDADDLAPVESLPDAA